MSENEFGTRPEASEASTTLSNDGMEMNSTHRQSENYPHKTV